MTRIQSLTRLASLRASCTTTTRARFAALQQQQQQQQQQSRALSSSASRSNSLRLPPKRRSEAETEQEAAAADPSYTPAETLADLDTSYSIPVMKSWWKQPQNWSADQEFKGFAPREKVTEKAVVEVMVKRALVEVTAVKELGAEGLKFGRWRDGGRRAMEMAVGMGLDVKDGKVVLGDGEKVKEVKESLTRWEERSGEVMTVEEAVEGMKGQDGEWKAVVLDDETKFLLRKRLFQLTGQLLPDAKLGAVRTPSDLTTLLSLTPKPKKLHLHLRSSPAFEGLSNVKIHGRRVTPIDKEKSVGRWKVIEEELVKRELPVTGKGEAPRQMERKWLAGRK